MQTLQAIWHILRMAAVIALLVLVVEIVMQGKNHHLIKREHGESKIWLERMKERLRVLRKCLRMLIRPIPRAGGAVALWFVLYYEGLYFPEKFETVAIAGLVLVISMFYTLIFSTALTFCLRRFQRLRDACRMPDWLQSTEAADMSKQQKSIELTKALRTYVLLIDDNLPPLMRALVIVPSLLLVGVVMLVKYTDALCGVCGVGIVAYLLTMFYMILMEFDGIYNSFYQTKIPQLWRGLNVKAIRNCCRESEQVWFKQHTASWGPGLFSGGGDDGDIGDLEGKQ